MNFPNYQLIRPDVQDNTQIARTKVKEVFNREMFTHQNAT